MASQILVLIILIALNAFFAATEIAFISLNDVKIELKRIGNNLNQLTRLCNEGKINAIGLEDLKSEVSKIWQLLNLLTQKLH